MKFLVLLFALAVCVNAKLPSSIVVKTEIVEKIELQSASATIVTELLETTFHVPAELAKEIGHIFRNVPLGLAKEMAALIVKTGATFGPLAKETIAFANNFGFGGTNNQLTRRQGCPPGCYYPMTGLPCTQGICQDGCCEL